MLSYHLYNRTFNQIIRNNQASDPLQAKKILILFEPSQFYIGDAIRVFSYLGNCQYFFKNALIDINCFTWYRTCYDLLLHNPYINLVSNHSWQNIAFKHYDLVIIISSYEKDLLELLGERYETDPELSSFQTAIFSYSTALVKPEDSIFPVFTALAEMEVDPALEITENGTKLFISPEEKQWGEQWLRENGGGQTENIIIMLDSSSDREKLLKLDVYFEILTYFSNKSNTKILIFDESNLDKKLIYDQWLDESITEKLIVAKGLSLREACCLLSSSSVKVIFGPCTGLLHCASGIYKVFQKSAPGYPIPLMVPYAGRDNHNHNEWEWWGDSLVKCLILKEAVAGKKEISVLTENNQKGFLTCKEYSSDLIIGFLEENYSAEILG